MTLEYRIGDVWDRLAEIPDGSIDLIVTSPPFLALRSYLPADHPDKAKEIGSEATPAAFIDTLLALSAEWGRVLAPHGSLCVELGDTFAGAKSSDDGVTIDYLLPGHGSSITRTRSSHDKRGNGWPLAKSLTGIPTLYPWSLAYGRNLLTGQPSPAGQWRIRNVIVWARPNPPVGALGDKFRPATSYITVACKSAKRYFDLDAVRTEHKEPPPSEATAISRRRALNRNAPGNHTEDASAGIQANPAGAPPLDWHADHHPEDGDWLWKLSTQPYSGSHYATFPMALPKRLIEAMCPLRVCVVCGKPSERVLAPLTLDAYRGSDRPQTIRAVEMADAAGLTDEHVRAVMARGISEGGKAAVAPNGNGHNSADAERLAAEAKAVLGGYVREFTQTTTAQRDSTWSDCGCQCPTCGGKGAVRPSERHVPVHCPDCTDGRPWRTGRVLDPFAGSGTTLEAAQAVGRHAIGIDLDARNADLAQSRVGMFLSVEGAA